MRLKESTLRWSFEVFHVPGTKNTIPDLLSWQTNTSSLLKTTLECCRVYASEVQVEDNRQLEGMLEYMAAAVCVQPVTFSQVQDEVARDPEISLLKAQIEVGFSEDRRHLRSELNNFWRHREFLSISGGSPCTRGAWLSHRRLQGLYLSHCMQLTKALTVCN